VVGEVANAPVRVHQARLLGAGAAVAHQFHCSSPVTA
jgi:hypothetical protein